MADAPAGRHRAAALFGTLSLNTVCDRAAKLAPTQRRVSIALPKRADLTRAVTM